MSSLQLDERGLPRGYPFNAEWEVTPREVAKLRQEDPGLVLVDCRTRQERDLARIEGSLHIPMQELSRHMETLREHEDDMVVVYCHHGSRSLKVAAALRNAGFTNVRSMAGGIGLWSADIDPSVPAY